MSNFTHIDENGNAIMVDVSNKDKTLRTAKAVGEIKMSHECFNMIKEKKHKKGDVLTVAQIAGIMATKKNPELIPLCHNISLTSVKIDFTEIIDGYKVTSTVKCFGETGAEMEALTGVSVALLTIYDMCKAIDKRMIISNIHLENKTGGKSGDFNF